MRREPLQLVVLRIGRAVADVHVLEPGGDEQVGQRVGVNRPHVRDVANVALEEREPAGRIDGLEDDRRAGAQLVERGVEQRRQIAGLEMFDDLRGEEAAERSVGLRAQVGERVGFGDVQSLLPADVHHRRR